MKATFNLQKKPIRKNAVHCDNIEDLETVVLLDCIKFTVA